MKGTVGPLSVAAGIVVLIGGAALVASAAQHHHSARPTASAFTPSPVPVRTADPTPTPTPAPEPPPAGVRLIWRTVADDSPVIQAVDTSGVLRGALVLPQGINHYGEITPDGDGQRLLVSGDAPDHVMTAQGADLGVVPEGNYSDVFLSWAGDDTHFCGMARDQAGLSSHLFVTALGGRPRVVSAFSWPQGDGGAGLAACSVRSDVAVVRVTLGDDNAGHVVEYRVVRLSTGRTIRDVHPPEPDFSGPMPRPRAGALGDVRASADGTRMALVAWADPDAEPATTIVDTVSGRAVGHIRGGDVIFTDDDTAVSMDRIATDWHTGRVTTMPAYCCSPAGALKPGAEDVVIDIPTGPPPTPSTNPSQPGGEGPPPVYALLHPDGSVTRLAWGGARLL